MRALACVRNRNITVCGSDKADGQAQLTDLHSLAVWKGIYRRGSIALRVVSGSKVSAWWQHSLRGRIEVCVSGSRARVLHYSQAVTVGLLGIVWGDNAARRKARMRRTGELATISRVAIHGNRGIAMVTVCFRSVTSAWCLWDGTTVTADVHDVLAGRWLRKLAGLPRRQHRHCQLNVTRCLRGNERVHWLLESVATTIRRLHFGWRVELFVGYKLQWWRCRELVSFGVKQTEPGWGRQWITSHVWRL